MALRKKGFSAKQSRRTSRRMQDATVGTHVRRSSTTRTRSNAESVSFSSQRGQRRATRGQVDALLPSATTSDGSQAYRQRVSQRRYASEIKRKTRTRSLGTIAIAVLVVLALAVAAGVFAYMSSVGSALALKDSDAKDALVAGKSDEPYYTLVTVELGAVAVPLANEGPDVLLLVRVDEKSGSLTIVNVPENLQVAFDDNNRSSISSLAKQGDAALIGGITKFTGVSISHIVKIDQEGVVGLVDALDGIDVTLAQDVDDPHAGDLYLKAGPRTLTGSQALVYLRTDNLRFGQADRADNQMEFAALVIEKLFSTSGGLSFAAKLDSIGSFIQTDYSSNDLISLAGKFGGIQASSITTVTIPGYVSAETGVVNNSGSKFVGTSDEAQKLIEQIESGTYVDDGGVVDTSSVDPSSFTIEIQNGAEIVGAAAETRETLASHGFRVEEVGNAEQSVYTETLVICRGAEHRDQAQAIIDTLGVGRIVDSDAYYEFETDVLLILGSDYKPMK